MSNGEWTDGDEPDIGARCLMVCREVQFDGSQPESPYSLIGLVSDLRPRGHFPLVLDIPLSLFAEIFGTPGEYEVWIDLVRLEYDEEEGLIGDGTDEVCYGPYVLNLMPDVFVHSRWYHLRKVPFQQPGLHEFRLRVAGVSEPLFIQRLFVRG